MTTDHDGVFWDAEESEFYGMAVRTLLRDARFAGGTSHQLVELGSGTGRPMLEVLRDPSLDVRTIGYEISDKAYEFASRLVAEAEMTDRYELRHADFFDHDPEDGLIAVSNPPYIPAPDSEGLALPDLWAGIEGTTFVSGLLDSGFDRIISTLSSYSNPLGILDLANERGYSVVTFMIKTIAFGEWSRQDKVMRHIEYLASQGKAFVHDEGYCLAVVAWSKNNTGRDATESLRYAIQCAGTEVVEEADLRRPEQSSPVYPSGLRRIK